MPLLKRTTNKNIQNHEFLIDTWSNRTFKGTFVNRALPSLHGIEGVTWNFTNNPFKCCKKNFLSSLQGMLMLGQEGSALVMSIPDMTREQLLRGTASLTSGFLHCNRLIRDFYIVTG